MKRVIACAALLLVLPACAPRAPYPDVEPREWDYQRAYCDRRGWKVEVVLPDGTRADCLSPAHAIELDRVYKWRQCLDQAEHYAARTGLNPLCVLIDDAGVTDALKQKIRGAASARGVELDWIVPPEYN